jgi:hypothetical protein
MLFTVKEDLDLIKFFKITPKQLMFIKMLVKDPSLDDALWRRQSYALSMEFNDLCPLTSDELADLISREILIDYSGIGGSIEIDYLEIHPKFKSKFMLKVTPLSSELFEEYPPCFKNDGVIYNARTASAQEIAPAYMRAIAKSTDEHEKILDDLRWAVKNNVLKIGLDKFVKSRYWEVIRDMRKNYNSSTINKIKIG